MGLVNKLKNMFTEEVEVEEPIKKEVMHVEIKAPEKEETPVEEKFNFPVYFDDKDFETLEKPKPVSKPVYKNTEPVEKRVFKPTPIISPVYGVLDKNYHKEDITTKQYEENYIRPKATSIDEVRKKAFGTLEDELESNLVDNGLFFAKQPIVEEQNDDLFDEMKNEVDTFEEVKNEYIEETDEEVLEEVETLNNHIDDLFTQLEKDNDVDLVDGIGISIEEENDENYTVKETDESLTESDLFDLVDMMYEKRDESDE